MVFWKFKKGEWLGSFRFKVSASQYFAFVSIKTFFSTPLNNIRQNRSYSEKFLFFLFSLPFSSVWLMIVAKGSNFCAFFPHFRSWMERIPSFYTVCKQKQGTIMSHVCDLMLYFLFFFAELIWLFIWFACVICE